MDTKLAYSIVAFIQDRAASIEKLGKFPTLSFTNGSQLLDQLQTRAHGAEWRAPEHRSREAQRAACRSAAGQRSRQPLEAASAESEGP